MKQLSEKLFVSPQPAAGDIAAARAAGIVAIVNNRPDGEEPGQPGAADGAMHAQAHSMGYVHIPVVPGGITEMQVRAFQRAVASAPGPVLAHCRTGTRSVMLHVIGEGLDGKLGRTQIEALGERLGIDLSGATRWLDIHGSQTSWGDRA